MCLSVSTFFFPHTPRPRLTNDLERKSYTFTLEFTASALLVLRPLEDTYGVTTPTLPGLLLPESSI